MRHGKNTASVTHYAKRDKRMELGENMVKKKIFFRKEKSNEKNNRVWVGTLALNYILCDCDKK